MDTSATPQQEFVANSPQEPSPINRLNDETIVQILEYCCLSSRPQCHLRLVSKRFSALVLPSILRTISIHSPEELVRLIHSTHSPLLNEEFSKHILCLEICFVPHNFVLNDADDLPNMCPNLVVVRFRFDLGVDATKLPEEDAFVRVVTHDAVFAKKREASHQTWTDFLSKFNPKKFEWVASSNRTVRLVGVHRHLRHLLSSWTNLDLVFLDGICLLEENAISSSWQVWLPANTVVIRGPFYSGILRFLYKIERIHAAPSCHLLMLESCDNAFEMRQAYAHGVPAVSLPDNTLVTTVGWSYAERKLLVSGLTIDPSHAPASNTTSGGTNTGVASEGRRESTHSASETSGFSVRLAVFTILLCPMLFIPGVPVIGTGIGGRTSFDIGTRFRFAGFFKYNKPPHPSHPPHPIAFNREKMPVYVVPTPSISITEPVAIPSCWCSCDHISNSLPSMKQVVYS